MASREIELAWAAGFMDGEGCTHARVRTDRRRGTNIGMSIAQTDRAVLERFKSAVLGVGAIYERNGLRPRKPTYKPIWSWSCQNWRDVQTVYALLWKFLSEPKRRQVLAAVALFRSDDGWGRPTGRPKGSKNGH